MTKRADQLHHDNAPAHSTALVQLFFSQSLASPRSISPPTSQIWPLRILAFLKAKIAVEREEICECDVHTVHKVRQRRLTAD